MEVVCGHHFQQHSFPQRDIAIYMNFRYMHRQPESGAYVFFKTSRRLVPISVFFNSTSKGLSEPKGSHPAHGRGKQRKRNPTI